jgi:RHS repeat-associated protein
LADYSWLGLGAVVEVTSVQPNLKFTLVGTAGGIDPDTGDIYRGLDRFARIKDLLWFNTSTSATVERVQHGYDRAGNRLSRADLADTARLHDELYGYDGLDRITTLNRGTLNSTETGLTAETFAQCWTLDSTGNWAGFRQGNTGSGTWDLIQSRTASTVNEISAISNSVGTAWVQPGYDAAGNMTTIPQPGALGQSYAAVYDAWNRLTRLSSGGNTVAGYQYDGLKRRVVKQRYSAGVLRETRHLYHSTVWQVLEERVGTATTAERQFVWGLRYLDDLVLRDRDTTGGGTLNERFYGVQDPNWNVTALVDSGGVVQERYGYDAYGVPAVLTAGFGGRATSLYDSESRYGGYRWDSEAGLYPVRHRVYHPSLGCWLSRDPLGSASEETNFNRYVLNNPIAFLDPAGLEEEDCCGLDVTVQLPRLLHAARAAFYSLSGKDKVRTCVSMESESGWDIWEFYRAGGGGLSTDRRRDPDEFVLDEYVNVFQEGPCGSGDCQGSVTFIGECYWAAEANYLLWGFARRMCRDFYRDVGAKIKIGGMYDALHYYDVNGQYGGPTITLANTLELVWLYRKLKYGHRDITDPSPRYRSSGSGIPGRLSWTEAGWHREVSYAVSANISARCSPCKTQYRGVLRGYFGRDNDGKPICEFEAPAY